MSRVLYVCVFYHSLLFGTLYPAYCSFKAVKSKNVKEYVSTQFIKAHAYLYPCSTDSSHLNIWVQRMLIARIDKELQLNFLYILVTLRIWRRLSVTKPWAVEQFNTVLPPCVPCLWFVYFLFFLYKKYCDCTMVQWYHCTLMYII